ncbi:hypothetical protein C5167_024079 [Papaver somniferum]|uniref:Peptidoglycan binding-like domain-containing protein n=1 Tax=Papaver somniferum TaxID=3469 RepID=A0A4Y7JRK1_PAPSO|nr:protein disulfide isomerase pTAC5, chloroplastic-like [Papaver somniferum]RZC62325.1 hypothetical protein C5167_024079 [Papaver somniferum]
MSSFLLPFQLNPPPPPQPTTTTTATTSLFCGIHSYPAKLYNSFQIRKSKKNFHYYNHSTFSCSSSSSSSDWEREEERWLREEQRWQREEKRWVREESRWNLERQSYLEEIASLKFRIQNLERLKNSTDIITSSTSSDNNNNNNKTLTDISPSAAAALLPGEINQITEIGSGPSPIQFHSEIQQQDYNEEIELKPKEVRVVEKSIKKKRSTIRKGAEGEDVREMQDALQKLGFYSGEEDVEFSSFGSDTERAIKSWQASIEAREDGVMTAELLEKLFSEVEMGDTGSGIPTENKEVAATMPQVGNATVTEAPAFLQNTAKESSSDEYGPSRRNRVFLLGENRWEDSSRLIGRKDGADKMAVGTMRCITCRGEGRLLCEECDGTGEPNIEEQFLEWVDEGANCPYCEGLGYNICDVCEGETIVISPS